MNKRVLQQIRVIRSTGKSTYLRAVLEMRAAHSKYFMKKYDMAETVFSAQKDIRLYKRIGYHTKGVLWTNELS